MDGCQAKIGDFGEAVILPSETHLLMTSNCGTTEFRAPEAFNKFARQGYNFLIDVWSLGMVIYGKKKKIKSDHLIIFFSC